MLTLTNCDTLFKRPWANIAGPIGGCTAKGVKQLGPGRLAGEANGAPRASLPTLPLS